MFKNFTFHIAAIIFCVSILHNSTDAQELNLNIDKIGAKDGLSNNTVQSIIQDKQGFMWFGTESGLNRFDGSDFKIYYNNPNDSNSLATNMIKDIFYVTKENLWLVTSIGGLNKLELQNERVTRYVYQYKVSDSLNLNIYKNAAVFDKDSTLWFSYRRQGLYSVKLNSKQLKIYKHLNSNNNSLISNRIRSLFVDKEGTVWIGTDKGVLSSFDQKTQKFTHFTIQEFNNTKKSPPYIWKIFEDHSGLFWICLGDALYTFNKKTGDTKLMIRNDNQDNYYFSSGFVSSIIEDKSNVIWIGTDKGLYRYDRLSNKFVNLHEQNNYKFILTDKNILSLYQDKSGIIWVGTASSGLYKIYPALKALKTLYHKPNNSYSISQGNVRSIYYDHKDYLWVGVAGDGINILKNGKKIAHFIHDKNNPNSLSNYGVTGIIRDSKGNYWISSGGGGIRVLKNYNPAQSQNAKFLSYQHKPNDSTSLSSNHVTVIFEDSKKKIWIGTNSGLNLFDPVNNQFIHPKFNLKDGNSPLAVQSNCILEDNTGAIWVGTWFGLYKFNYSIESGQITIDNAVRFTKSNNVSNSLSDNRITALNIDSLGNIWIGTYGGGLNKLNIITDMSNEKSDYKFTNFTLLHGLPSNEIYGIQSDNKNNLWMSTNDGISRFNTKNLQVKNYNIYDGLRSNTFYWGASYKNDNGEIFFGSTDGLTYFYPDSLIRENNTLGIVFTNFKLKNKEVKPGINSPLKEQIGFAKKIILDYSFETFTIEFISLNYSSWHKSKYKFKLEGYNKEWVETDKMNRTATYTNLNPGDYVFKVIASNPEDSEVQLTAEIEIKVNRPFWQTWWFYSLEVLFVLLLIFFFVKVRIKKLKSDNDRLELVVKGRTAILKQQNEEISRFSEETQAQKKQLLYQKNEILKQNREINEHRNQLEQKVKDRTKEFLKAKEDADKAREDAERADLLKTVFLENLSHEIRTPLNAVVGFSSLLGLSENLSKKDVEYINHITTGSENLLKIIDSVVQVSKIQLGEYELSYTRFNVNTLMQLLYNEFKNVQIKSKKAMLELRLNTNRVGENIELYSDKKAIQMVFFNLVGNAIKYTESGFVEFGIANSTEEAIQFYVKDTGIGISEKDIKFIFDKFRKIDPNKTKLYRGLGLGLTIVKRIIEKLNGEIWVESELNKGSCFYFLVPVAE